MDSGLPAEPPSASDRWQRFVEQWIPEWIRKEVVEVRNAPAALLVVAGLGLAGGWIAARTFDAQQIATMEQRIAFLQDGGTDGSPKKAVATKPAAVEPPPPCTSYLEKSPNDLWKEEDERTPYEKSQRWTKYEQMCVRWTLKFRSLDWAQRSGWVVHLDVDNPPGALSHVAAHVNLDRTPELKLAKEDERITVVGRLYYLSSIVIGVYNAEVTFPDRAPGP